MQCAERPVAVLHRQRVVQPELGADAFDEVLAATGLKGGGAHHGVDRVARHQMEEAEDNQRGQYQYGHRLQETAGNEVNHGEGRSSPT